MEESTLTVCNYTAPRVGSTAPMPTRGHLVGAGSSTINYYRVQMDGNNTYKFHLIDGQQRSQHSGNNLEWVKTNQCYDKCKTCTQVDKNTEYVTSFISKKQFLPINITRCKLTCKTKCLVYLITCKKCQCQYVGETKRRLVDRASEHIYNVKKGNKTTFLYEHFTENGHKYTDMQFKILQTCNYKYELKIAELFWITTLQTVYPCGLNDEIKGYGKISDYMFKLKGKIIPYFGQKLPRQQRAHGRRRRNSKVMDTAYVDQWLLNDIMKPESIRKLVNSLHAQSKKTLLYTFAKIIPRSKQTNLIKGILASYLEYRNYNWQQVNKKKHKEYLSIPFPGKNYNVNVKRIITNRQVKMAMPPQLKAIDIIPVFTYTPTVGDYMFNHKRLLKRLNNQPSALQHTAKLPCRCHSSTFIYEPYKHIFTGDMTICNNDKVASILTKGANFRPIYNKDITQVTNEFRDALSSFSRHMAKKYQISPPELHPWETNFTRIHKQIYLAKNNTNNYAATDRHIELLRDYTKQISKDLVITPIDKAKNNIAFICKQFYISVLCKELGYNQDFIAQGNEVYQPTNFTLQTIVKNHISLNARYRQHISNENRTLPLLYAIPKMHKVPYKFRFIAGAKFCTTKSIAILLHRILVFCRQQLLDIANLINYRKRKKVFYSIKNSEEVIVRCNNLTKIPKTVRTADFTTLFTNLPHKDIYSALTYLTKLIFNTQHKDTLVVTYKNVYLTNQRIPKHGLAFTHPEVCKLVFDVVNETYVACFGNIFKQIKGVPMGGNASPDIADLALAAMEYKYSIINTNEQLHFYRYVDDLLLFDCKAFASIAPLIYGNDLGIESTLPSDSANFLDLNVQCKDKGIRFRIHDKTDMFNFGVNKYASNDSNVDEKVHYNIMFTQILRAIKLNSQFNDFKTHFFKLCNVFIRKGFPVTMLYEITYKVCTRNICLLHKYNIIGPDNVKKVLRWLYYEYASHHRNF